MPKVLIQRADRLGDMILALPVIEALKAHLPDTTIHVLASPISKALLEAHPLVSKVLVVEWDKNQKIANKKKLLSRMRYEQYDTYISLWNHPEMAHLGFRGRIPIRIGDKSCLFFLNRPVDQRLGDITQHQVEQNLRLLEPLIPKRHLSKPILKLYPDPDWQPTETIHHTQKKLLIFHGSGGSNHALTEEAIIHLIDALEGQQHVILCYGKVDPHSKLTHLARPHLTNITVDLSLTELQSWINYADYYVGSDTGPTHMASFLNKPMLVFSPKKSNMPSRWGPLSDYFIIMREDFQCTHPCLSKCLAPPHCSHVNPETLVIKYQQLIDLVSTTPPLTQKQKKRDHLRHTFRIAYVVKTIEEYNELKPIVDKLAKKNLKIFLVCGTSLKQLIASVTRRNITHIQGPIPLWKRLALQFYMTTLKQYFAPKYISLPLHAYITSKEWIDIYHDAQ
jgi:ADP-heptose:LPS heptosyltransferase